MFTMPELDFDEMLASLAAAASDDPTDHMPMTCTLNLN